MHPLSTITLLAVTATSAIDDDSAAALFAAIPYICGVLGHHLAPNHNGNHKGGVETDILLHAPVFHSVSLCAPPWPLVEKRGHWEPGQRPPVVAKTCGGGLGAFYGGVDAVDVDGPCERRFDPRNNRGMFHYWTNRDVQISSRLRLPPPARARSLGGDAARDPRVVVISTPHLARDGRAQTCPFVRASCFSFGQVVQMARAAVAAGFKVKLWATNLEDGDYGVRNGGKRVKSEVVAAETTAAADAVAKLFDGDVAVVGRDEAWRGGVPQHNLTAILRDLGDASLYVSGFGGVGAASLAYLGARHVIFCGDGLHKDTKGLFCDADLLESVGRQTVHLEETAAGAIAKALALMKGGPGTVPGARLAPYPAERDLRRAAVALYPASPLLARLARPWGEGGIWDAPPAGALPWLCKHARARPSDPAGHKPFSGEFGPELVTKVPHEYFMHQCGAVAKTSSCGDLSMFYFFSPAHENLPCLRHGGQMTFSGIVGGYFANTPLLWAPPPIRSHFAAMAPVLDHGAAKTVAIFNRLDCRPCATGPCGGRGDLCCKQYMANSVLRRVLAAIDAMVPRVRAIYVRVNHADARLKGLSKERGDEYQDSNRMQGILRVCGRGGCEVSDAEARTAEPLAEIRDEAMIRAEFPGTVILADAYHERPERHRNMTWNEFMGVALGQSSSFVSVQGGGSYLASYFGGCNEVIDFYGTSNSAKAHDPPFVPECPEEGLPEVHKMDYVTDTPPNPRARERQRARGAQQRAAAGGRAGSMLATRARRRLDARRPEARRLLGNATDDDADDDDADDDAQARRRLPEVQETYSITLPRLSGARVTNHREGHNLVAAVAGWATDPKCGLVAA